MKLYCFEIKIKRLALVMVMSAILIALGSWQLERLVWKENVISMLEEARAKPAEVLPKTISPLDDLAYQKFFVAGRFLETELTLPLKQENGVQGAHVISAFATEDGRVLFVNRGFLPEGKTAAPAPTENITIQGVLRPDEAESSFSLKNDVAQKLFYRVRIEDFKTLLPAGAEVIPYLLILERGDKTEMIFPRPLPSAYPSLRNNHRDYALFWFTMAGILWVIFLISSYHKARANA
jgi:surfeit locus 1 family protein